MGDCNCSMFCCILLYVHSSIAIIFMGKREPVALLNLSSWCLVMVERLFLEVPWGCLRFVIVVFPDHTHSLFLLVLNMSYFSHQLYLKVLYINYLYNFSPNISYSLFHNTTCLVFICICTCLSMIISFYVCLDCRGGS